jgi:protein-L-isoaspartate(D-aspartate) O-methyltransferase
MVQVQMERRGVRDARVLEAMRTVPREAFVPDVSRPFAYEDRALPIACEQTISQPYVVALMVEALRPDHDAKVLEVGAGSGYAAAVLAVLVREVFAIERHEPLAEEAAERLARLGYANVTLRAGDGTLGWPDEAPFDGILVSAAAPRAPRPLLEQLAVGGRLVVPIGDGGSSQQIVRLTRRDTGFESEHLGGVRFVPLVGAEGWPEGPS